MELDVAECADKLLELPNAAVLLEKTKTKPNKVLNKTPNFLLSVKSISFSVFTQLKPDVFS